MSPTPAARVVRALLAVLVLAVLPLAVAGPAHAQRPPDMTLTPEINAEVVENTIVALDKYYLSAEVARKVGDGLRERLERGDYDALTSAFALVDALDRDLQRLSKDAHLALAYSDREAPPVRVVGENIRPETPAERAESLAEARRRHFGIGKTTRLPGNVAVLELESFERPEFAGEALGAAMAAVADADALILDLRASRGGSPDMVVFLASYFFPGDEPRRLVDWETRAEGEVQQCWSYAYVPGQRFLEKDVYVLTSRATFSAPEGLAALLQHHGRAKIVGEKTAGGTHPGVMVRVQSHFAVFVPVSYPVYPAGTPSFPLARPVYPEGRADTLGTGVQPDIAVAADKALEAAHLAALESLQARDPGRRTTLSPLVEKLRQALGR